MRENDTGPNECNYTRLGRSIPASSNSALQNPYDGVRLLDIGPTRLERAGDEIPPSPRGRSLVTGQQPSRPADHAGDDEDRASSAIGRAAWAESLERISGPVPCRGAGPEPSAPTRPDGRSSGPRDRTAATALISLPRSESKIPSGDAER